MREKVQTLCNNKQRKSENIALLCSKVSFREVSQQDCLLEGKKKGRKEKWCQRHNLTVQSLLPVARSGAVG
jgi:hypothetical protein